MTPSSAVIKPTETLFFLHASAVKVEEKAILLIGRPGAGKSSRVISLIRQGATLIADDYVKLERKKEGIMVSPACITKGLIEWKGTGIARLPYMERALLDMVVLLDESRVPEWIGNADELSIARERRV